MSRCTHVPSLVSLAQNFLKPKDPSSKRFSAPGTCNLRPTEMAPPKDFKLVRYAYDLRVWDGWHHPCAPQDREKMMRSKHFHVHCTCTLHPSPLIHTASSRYCQGAPVYRDWCPWLKVSLNRRTPCQKSFPPLARAACAPLERHPQRILSWGGMGVTWELDIGSAPCLTCRCVNVFLQAFSGRHVPRATCCRSTPDRHQRRSGGSGRRPVPPPSRSDQPIRCYSQKCLDIHTD